MTEHVPGDGMPPAPQDGDEELNIENKGQRIAVLLVAVLLLAAGVVGFMMYSKRQSAIAEVETLKAEFSDCHVNGYERFWKTVRLDLSELKTSAVLEARLTEYLAVSSISYSEHVQKEALPILDEALPELRSLEANGILVPELKAVHASLKQLQETWQRFADQVTLYKDYLENRGKLKEVAGQWSAAQQMPDEEKYRADAAKYLRIVNCVLDEGSAIDHEPFDLSYRLKDTCAKVSEQAAWFSRVAFRCLDYIGKDVEPDAVYDETVNQYAQEKNPKNQDQASDSAILQCLDISRKTFESEMIQSIVEAWADYVKKKNAFVQAADERLASL